MRVILDTNILISAFINPHGLSARLLVAWRRQQYELITSSQQLIEFGEIAYHRALRAYIFPEWVSQFVQDLHSLARLLRDPPTGKHSDDPIDDYLLAMADAGNADYIVSDRPSVLNLKLCAITRMVTPQDFAALFGSKYEKK